VTSDKTPSRLRCVGWSIVLTLAVPVELGIGLVLLLGAALLPFGIGLWVTGRAYGWLRAAADLHRLWAAQVMGTPIPRPYRQLPAHGQLARLRGYTTDPATWRDLRWLLTELTIGMMLAALPAASVFLGLLCFAVMISKISESPSPPGYYLDAHSTNHALWLGLVLAIILAALLLLVTKPAMRGYTWLQRWFLAPAEATRLATRIAELTRSRADVVDTQSAEIRRIERDLHDGAQARLVSLGMSLGMAEKLFADDPATARELLVEAKQATGFALSELRQLVRGIHPPILADRGLEGAVQALALSSAVPIERSGELPGRPPAPVESAMYFALTEVLTNMAKHSGANAAWIRLAYDAGRLCVMVGDNGRGGATMPIGGGLAGLERRLAGFDGSVSVASPIGGPTIVTMELPCELAYASS
jgi:signal transduction histidine kinase